MTQNQVRSPSGIMYAPQPIKRRLQLRISERRLLLMFGDALAVVAATFIALLIWAAVNSAVFDANRPFTEFLSSQAAWFFVLTPLWFLLASANDYYELSVAARRGLSLQKLAFITLQLLVVYLLIFFFSARDALPRLFIIYYGVTSFGLLAAWRLLNPALIGWASVARRVYIVGAGHATATLIDTLKETAQDSYVVAGIIATPELIGQTVRDIPVIGTAENLPNLIQRDNVRELIITSTRDMPDVIFQGVMDAYEGGIAITPMPILYERLTGRVPVEHVGDAWSLVLPMEGTSIFAVYPAVKRLTDIMLAFIGLLVYLPLLPFLALAIYINSPGPIFYSQQRVGLNGRLFKITKLRTMIPDAEKQTGAVFAQERDPRITHVGRFLRKTRLDELPQIVNILRGDMSLIGPRPERPEHVSRLQQKIPFYRTRHTTRPGLTGWAQVRYKYGADDTDALVKLQYDLYYIRHASPALDAVILIRTIGKVLRMGGQ